MYPSVCVPWKGLDAVRGREEGGLNIVLLVKLEQTVDTYGSAVDAARDVGGVLR